MSYPTHLVRFPSAFTPRSGRRRASARSVVYWGHHWVWGLIFLYLWAVIVLLVLCVWLVWVVLVTIAWACTLPFSPLRGQS